MPIYEFQCDDCGQAFEVLAASRTTKVRCTSCDSRRVRRLLSTFAAHGSSDLAPCDDGKCPSSAAGPCAGKKTCPFS